MKKNSFTHFIYHLPPLLVILAGTALFFGIGYLLGIPLSHIMKDKAIMLDIASIFALIIGAGGSILLLMQQD